MFEISQLKEKPLVELQQIAKDIELSKFSQLKKLDLVYQILDHQASNPTKQESTTEKPKRKRISKPQNNAPKKSPIAKEVKKEEITKEVKEVKQNSPQKELKFEEKQSKPTPKPQHKTSKPTVQKNTEQVKEVVKTPEVSTPAVTNKTVENKNVPNVQA